MSALYSVVWLSYSLDGPNLVASVKNFILTKKDSKQYILHVLDDGFDPIKDQSILDELQSLGVHYKRTYYNRNGNLLGGENLRNQIEKFLEITESDKSDVIVKCDCDTIILKKDWIEDLAKDPKATLAGTFKLYPFYVQGCSYAIKASALQGLLDDTKIYPGFANCFEDYEVGIRLMRNANNSIEYAHRYKFLSNNGGFQIIDPPQLKSENFSARVLSLGWNVKPVPADKKPEYKKSQTTVMNAIYEARKKALMPPDTKGEDTKDTKKEDSK